MLLPFYGIIDTLPYRWFVKIKWHSIFSSYSIPNAQNFAPRVSLPSWGLVANRYRKSYSPSLVYDNVTVAEYKVVFVRIIITVNQA